MANAEIISTTVDDVTVAGHSGVAISGLVENVSDILLYNTQVRAKYYNDSGELIDTRRADARYLAPGEQWEFWLEYGAPGVTNADAEMVSTTASEVVQSPEEIELRDHSMEVPTADHASPLITGTIANKRNAEANIRVGGKVYAKNGHVLATGSDRVNYADPDDIWRFDIQAPIYNSDWKARISDYELLVTLS